MSVMNFGLSPLEIDVNATVAALGDPDVQIIDCREQNEWDAAHVDGMTLMPLDTIGQRLGELDRSSARLSSCVGQGVAVLIAAEQCWPRGFADVKSMNGGLIAWAELGHPLVASKKEGRNGN